MGEEIMMHWVVYCATPDVVKHAIPEYTVNTGNVAMKGGAYK